MTARLAALAILDIALWSLCAIGGIASGWALGAHAVLTALGYVLWLRSGPMLSFAAAILGVLGPAGIAVALPLVRRRTAPAAQTDDAIFGPAAVRVGQRGASLAAARMLDGRVHHAGPETLSSLVTILRHGDVGARRRALETVVRSFEPSLSPLIALALTDGDQTIRALAAAASSRVAHNLMLTRATLAERTDDPEAASRLVALLADHARADVLLSDSQRGHLRDDAVAMMPATDPARQALAIEALWAAGDYAAIDAMAADTLAAGPEATSPEALTVARWWQGHAAA